MRLLRLHRNVAFICGHAPNPGIADSQKMLAFHTVPNRGKTIGDSQILRYITAHNEGLQYLIQKIINNHQSYLLQIKHIELFCSCSIHLIYLKIELIIDLKSRCITNILINKQFYFNLVIQLILFVILNICKINVYVVESIFK